MSEITQSLKKHRRQNNMLSQIRMSLTKGKFIGPYEIIDFLKEGSSSKIYLAKSQYTKETVAIKAINKNKFQKNLDNLLLITKQIESLKILKHRNIITLYEIYESQKYIYLITEYCSGKDLIEKIIRKKRFNEEEALLIFFQLLDAFSYMHKMNICHRNVRTEHILFDKNNRPKIVGFGYSSFYQKNKKIEGTFGSLCYACPEIIDEQPYDPELADVWSLGVVLYVLICGYLPFSDEDDNKNKMLISEGKIEFPKEMSNKLKDLLRHMLDKDPNKRYNFQKVAKHPWIKPYSESFFSQGINVYKIIFPVEEKILNIINEYDLDKMKVKEDLIKNKFNIGTGLYKQIVRKLMDLKIKNKSDLFSEEFNEYRDNKENEYKNGDERYEEYIQKVIERYNKKEDFVNEFKEREDQIVDKLIALKEQKEEKNKLFDLNVINEENDKEKEEDNDKENNIVNNDNIEIVYNNEQDIDIIQQFKEEQNKNKIIENKEIIKDDNKNKNILTPEDKSLRLTSASEISKGADFISNNLIPKSKTNSFLISPIYKSIANPNLLKSNNITKSTDRNNFRMTAIRKTKTKTTFDRGSLYDDFLKRSHPENVRKTMLKSKFSILYENIDKDIEDIKEKDESEENEEKKENDNIKTNNINALKYSLSFDDEDDNEENNEQNDEDDMIDLYDGDGDDKLFNLLNNDDDEEIKELKKLYYGDNLKESIKLLKKSKKKKTVKFKEDVDNKEKNNNDIKRTGTNTSGLDIDKYEEKLNQYNKNLNNAQFEISFHEEKEKEVKPEEIIYFNKDKENTKKIELEKNEDIFNINVINSLLKKKYILKYFKGIPCKKIEIINNDDKIESINELFIKKNKKNPNNKKLSAKKIAAKLSEEKKDKSTQTNFPIIKLKIVHSFFSINTTNNINNQRYNSDNDNNYPYMYNGSNQVNINKYNNPIRLNYNRNELIQNKQKEIDKKKKVVKYFRKNNNVIIDTDKIKNNNSYTYERSSPAFGTKYNKKIDFLNLSNNLTPENHLLNSQVQKNKLYTINDYNNDDKREKYDHSNIAPRQNSALNSVKNIKKEVIVKRNEIIEKIQHCQNLLNTIMVDKKSGMDNMKNFINPNKSTDSINQNMLTYNKQIPRISEFETNKPNKKINNNKYYKGINKVYKKNNLNIITNTSNAINKYTYKRINLKYLDKPNDIYNFDNINRDNVDNSPSLTENNYINNTNYMKQLNTKKLKNYLDEEVNINNYSFDVPNKISGNSGYNNYKSYMNLIQRKIANNQNINKTFNGKNNDIFMKNVYRNNNMNNNRNQMDKKLNGY